MKRKMIYIILTLVLTVISISQASNKKLEISKEELSKIAERIFQNEWYFGRSINKAKSTKDR